MAHLESEYGLETLTYAELREELMFDDLTHLRDPYICVLIFEKIADRFTPIMTSREKSEHLIAKSGEDRYNRKRTKFCQHF